MTLLLNNPVQIRLCMADLQQHFILHRKNVSQIAATEVKDITGAELRRIVEDIEKKEKTDKEEEKGPEEKKKPETSQWNFNSPNFIYPLYGISAGITAGVALGSAILFSLYLIKPK